MAFNANTNLDAMPDDIRREYGSILVRLDANFIQSPDPVHSKEWVNDALVQLNRPPGYFGGLVSEDRIAVRNTILAGLITEAFNARKERDPAEDEKTAWHLAVKRGVEGYLSYDAAKLADLDRGASDAWGSVGQYFSESLGSQREEIFTTEDWPVLKARDRRNSSANFERNSEEEASRAARSVRDAAAVPNESAIRESGLARQPLMRQDPMEIARLAELQQAMERTRPSDEVFNRFRAKANLGGAATWESLTPEERLGFVSVASAEIYAEELAAHEMAGTARPDGMSDADFFTARRERAASDAESYYAKGVRPPVASVTRPAERDPFAVSTTDASPMASRGDGGAGDSGGAVVATGKGLPSWMAAYEKSIAEAGRSGTFQSESDAVRARLKDPQSDADRFLASVTNARTKGGEALDFNSVTWKGRSQQSAAYGAFWLSHGLLKEASTSGIGTPPRQYTVEAIVASPELQYQAARAHVEQLLATKLATGKSIGELAPEERAAALATAYRFGVERMSVATVRGRSSGAGRGDHWTAAVATPARAQFARADAPSGSDARLKADAPAAATPTETFSVPLPTTVEASRFLDAARERAAKDGVKLSEAQLGDRARLEAFYRSVLEKVAGVTKSSEIAELERLVPGLAVVTDGRMSMSTIELVASNGAIKFDPSMREMLAREIGLDVDPKTGKRPDVVEFLRSKAEEAKLAAEARNPSRAVEAEKPSKPGASPEAPPSSASALARVIADLRKDAGASGRSSTESLKVVDALEQWFKQPAIGARASEIAESLDKLSGAALRDRAVAVATTFTPTAGAAEEFVPFSEFLRRLEETRVPKSAQGAAESVEGVSRNATPLRAARAELVIGG